MDRFIRWTLVISCLAAAGCTSGGTTTPTTTAPVTVTDTFTGTLTPNGAASYPFTVLSTGTVTAQVTVLGGATPPIIGLGVGTWDSTNNGCSLANGKFNDKAVLGTAVTVTALAAGPLCVRIYDAAAAVIDPTAYEVQVVHP